MSLTHRPEGLAADGRRQIRIRHHSVVPCNYAWYKGRGTGTRVEGSLRSLDDRACNRNRRCPRATPSLRTSGDAHRVHYGKCPSSHSASEAAKPNRDFSIRMRLWMSDSSTPALSVGSVVWSAADPTMVEQAGLLPLRVRRSCPKRRLSQC